MLFLIKATLALGSKHKRDVHRAREVLEARPEGDVHRLEYSYQLMYRDWFLFRYDRDPENHPEMPERKHLPSNERRTAWDRVTFREVVGEAYDFLSEIKAQ